MDKNITRFVTGIGIIAIGLGLLLGNLNVFNFGDFIGTWWPLAIIIAGILILVNDIKNYIWALIVLAFGVALQLRELDIVTVSPWQFFWPLVIVAVGVSILVNRSSARQLVSREERDDIRAVLGGSQQKNRSEDFKGSKITAILGGVELDLRKAVIKHDATIEVFSLMGGVEIKVPHNVIVKNQTSAILGGVEDGTDQDVSKNAPTLYVTGEVILAGVEIKN
ncbi:MAG: hypothetical protein EOO17_02785 [Chloroflexi bacterium]|nr:MAG: hypothetical protein EOO17_02785 [Chloroflexota bacterium]